MARIIGYSKPHFYCFFSSQITEFHFCIFTVGPTLLHKICVHVYLLWSPSIVGLSAPEFTVWMEWISNRGRNKSSRSQKRPYWLWGPYSFHLNGYWIYFPVIKRLGSDAGHCQSAIDVETTWNCRPVCTLPVCLQRMWGTNLHYLFTSFMLCSG